MKIRGGRWVSVVVWMVAAAVAGCGGDGSRATGPSNGEGTLAVHLTDSPFSDAVAVLVTFSEVSAHQSGGPFVIVPFAGGHASRTCDLKKLAGAADVLGTGPLATGHYTQLRLVISGASIHFDGVPSGGNACAPTIAPPAGNTSSAPLQIPSGEVKLNREFDLTAGKGTSITLDFDGERSIKATGSGQFTLTPVIAVVSVL